MVGHLSKHYFLLFHPPPPLPIDQMRAAGNGKTGVGWEPKKIESHRENGIDLLPPPLSSSTILWREGGEERREQAASINPINNIYFFSPLKKMKKKKLWFSLLAKSGQATWQIWEESSGNLDKFASTRKRLFLTGKKGKFPHSIFFFWVAL